MNELKRFCLYLKTLTYYKDK